MFTLPDLPYGYDALQPTMSSETLHLHHDKHHARYFTVMNEILQGKGGDAGSLEDVVRQGRRQGRREEAVQQRRPSLEPHLLLAQHDSGQGRSFGRSGRGHRGLRRPGSPEDQVRRRGLRPLRLGLGVAGGRQVRRPVGGAEPRRREPARQGPRPRCWSPTLWEHAYYVDYKNDRKTFPGALVRRPAQLGLRRPACWPPPRARARCGRTHGRNRALGQRSGRAKSPQAAKR